MNFQSQHLNQHGYNVPSVKKVHDNTTTGQTPSAEEEHVKQLKAKERLQNEPFGLHKYCCQGFIINSQIGSFHFHGNLCYQ